MRKEIIFVTGNSLKVLHANVALEKFDYKVLGRKLDMIEPREEETSKIVIEKALQAFEIIKMPLMVEDSGIFIEALNGFPKTYVHFVQDTIGIEGIMKLMEGKENRSAEFRQSLAYMDENLGSPKVFSYTDGGYTVADKITEPMDGEDWSAFDKILIPPGENKTICMFTKEENAKRDATNNEGKIHYQLLAQWLDRTK